MGVDARVDYYNNSIKSSIDRQGALALFTSEQLVAHELDLAVSKDPVYTFEKAVTFMNEKPSTIIASSLALLNSIFSSQAVVIDDDIVMSDVATSQRQPIMAIDEGKLNRALLYASMYMVETSSLDDWNRRLQWIDSHLTANSDVAIMLRKVFDVVFAQGTLVQSANQLLQSLLRYWNLSNDSFMKFQVIFMNY